MKHYKLSDLKIGMKVYVDELTDIEGVYILLSDVYFRGTDHPSRSI